MNGHQRSVFAMNNPGEPLDVEIPFLLSCGVDGIEHTIEPPCSYFTQIADSWPLVEKHCRIAHTRDDLAFASRDPDQRTAAIAAMNDAFAVCKKLGFRRINVHPDRGSQGLSQSEVFDLNVCALSSLSQAASDLDLELMLENQPPFTSPSQIEDVLSAVSGELFVLLDIAHAHCYGKAQEIDEFITRLGKKIRHIHISDNRGENDEHLFPGYGSIKFDGLLDLINDNVDPSVAFSLESFRLFDGGALRMVTPQERGPLVSAAIDFINELR